MSARDSSKVEREARALAQRINAAIAELETFDEWAPVVVEQCRGIGGYVWITYVAFGSAHLWTKSQFHKVWQVRNSPVYRPQLFDAITAKRGRAARARRAAA